MAFAHRLADVAAEAIRPLFRTNLALDRKHQGIDATAIVTQADHAAEEAMRRLILETYPDHGILGEERGRENEGARLTWVLDPIDGTKAFVTGFPTWGTLIALNDGGRPVLGVCNQPHTGERFAGDARGTTLNGRRLATRPCPALAGATLAATSFEMFGEGAKREAFATLYRQAGLRRLGGDCYAYCMLAHGLIDIVVEADLAPWDIQALIPIVEGAGGVVTGWDGGPAAAGGCVVACGDRRLHAEVLPVLRRAL